MELTPEKIISTICVALKLDRKELDGRKWTQEYRDGRLLASYIMREKIVETKVVYSTRANGTRAYMEADKPITYKLVSKSLNWKTPQTAIASELSCKELLKTDKKFKEKYTMVVNLLDGKTNIA